MKRKSISETVRALWSGPSLPRFSDEMLRNTMNKQYGEDKETPLMTWLRCFHSHKDEPDMTRNDVTAQLVAATRCVDAVGLTGRTALHLAVGQDCVHAIDLLVAKGATLETEDLPGAKSLSEASWRYRDDTVACIQEHFARLRASRASAVKAALADVTRDGFPTPLCEMIAAYATGAFRPLPDTF
jgi:hypothetical protein